MLWYVAAIAGRCGLSLDEVARMNVVKLKTRYPDGFSEQDSINRKDT